MALHLQRQIDRINRQLLELGDLVCQAVAQAIEAVERGDVDAARNVIDNDVRIDQVEVEIEEQCLQTLALDQPVASDLRYLVATLKLNNDLERIGDLAVNIAEAAIKLAGMGQGGETYDMQSMGRSVRRMVDNALDALINVDPQLAQQVCQRDDQIDRIHRAMYRRVEQAIREDPEMVRRQILLLSVSRNLERMADHAVNIAEDVIYLAEGTIQRHRNTADFEDAEP